MFLAVTAPACVTLNFARPSVFLLEFPPAQIAYVPDGAIPVYVPVVAVKPFSNLSG
jgi:hypothetical protein